MSLSWKDVAATGTLWLIATARHAPTAAHGPERSRDYREVINSGQAARG